MPFKKTKLALSGKIIHDYKITKSSNGQLENLELELLS
jgi:hypothetical protein